MNLTDANSEFEALLDYLKRSRGFDFTGYKRASLMRRISKQMLASSVESYAEYMDYLEANPEEITRLLSTLLINVTSFFRDPAVWEMFSAQVLPQLIQTKAEGQPVRAWSAGCAGGEEAFTLAIALAEVMGLESFSSRVKIYATDIDEEALMQARQATFSSAHVMDIPPTLLHKYFNASGGRYALNKELRRAIIFGRHNLVQDVPISHLDILLCRNTLMYFNAEVQSRILSRFHFALNDSGFLVLGKAETLLINSHLFTPLDLKRRIFVKVSTGSKRRATSLPQMESEEARFMPSNPARPLEMAFDSSPLAQVVVDAAGQLAATNERARVLFRLTLRDIGRPFQDMELSYRPVELRSFIEKVNAERYPITLKEIVSRGSAEGEVTFFDVHIVPLISTSSEPIGVNISFLDVTTHKRLHEELEASNRELSGAYEEAQSAAEELETTNEELQASAEELETTNEELQSTNEEMETMNEELQSANEELQTMNDELRQRSLEISAVSDLMEAVLGSLRGGVVVTDTDLRVQTWNYQAEDFWGIRADEAIGKSLLTLDIGLPIDQLVPHLRACLAGLSMFEEVNLEATNRRGRTIRCRVGCTPLKDRDQNTRGTVLVMQESGRTRLLPETEAGSGNGVGDAADGHSANQDGSVPVEDAEGAQPQ